MIRPVPDDLNRLRRMATAAALAAAGLLIPDKTATTASHDGGPPDRLFGRGPSTAHWATFLHRRKSPETDRRK